MDPEFTDSDDDKRNKRQQQNLGNQQQQQQQQPSSSLPIVHSMVHPIPNIGIPTSVPTVGVPWPSNQWPTGSSYLPPFAFPNSMLMPGIHPLQYSPYLTPHMNTISMAQHHSSLQQQQQHPPQHQQSYQMPPPLQPNLNPMMSLNGGGGANNSMPPRACRLKRPSVQRQSSPNLDSEDESSIPSDDFPTPSSSNGMSDSDTTDSNFGSSRRAARNRKSRGRPKNLPRASRPKLFSKDQSDDSDHTFNCKRRSIKSKKPRSCLADDLMIYHSGMESDGSSDSSFCSNRGKRRRKTGSPSPETRRISSRIPTKTQRINYAELGQNFESDAEDREADQLIALEKTAKHDGIGIDRVLYYRRANCPNEEPSVVPIASTSSTTIHEFEFSIKWTKTAHLHNTWENYESLLERNIPGVRKVENYFRRMQTLQTERLRMTEDEIEQQNIAFELQKQIDQDCLIAERIIAQKKGEPVPKPSTSPGTNETASSSPSVVTDLYLVKWTNSPYDQCTWETQNTLIENKFEFLLKEYETRQSRLQGVLSSSHPLHNHQLSRTNFEPYSSTPFYMQSDRPLRDYQLTGLNWMISRMKKGMSVLLADEMGLGKTVQTISVIGHLMFAELLIGPYLVIVPQSTADNWLSEFRRWLPEANVIVYHGNPQAREMIRTFEMARVKAKPFSSTESNSTLPGFQIPLANTKRSRFLCDVVIATPSILNNPDDLDFLRYLMAIDEAHLLKNRESKRFKELDLFKTRYRLLLSGTPLHNNLEEMWSLLRFLCPEKYNDLDDFKRRFSEIERIDSVGEMKEKQLATLQRDLHELVLRRVKKDVEKSLPKKVERILRVEVSPKQAECCEAVIARNYEVLAKSTGGTKASLQNICMELKKVCNHPLLLQRDHEISALQTDNSIQGRQEWHQTLLHSSTKLTLLDKLLPYLKEKNHRVLIFSQMVRMLNLLSTYLTLRGFKHQRLDGTMGREVRKKAMDHFNAPDSDDFCFLLSTKAGGLGINLTTADTVIIYDSDWNPQNDLQAEARAHRIGQTKTVQIYRLVTKDTVEEKILEKAKAKMVLDTLVVQGLNKKQTNSTISDNNVNNTNDTSPNVVGNNLSMNKSGVSFSREELTKILKFGAQKLWKTKEMNNNENTVDLDQILAEAEERDVEGQGGLADELLSSFTNISDFRYEAPPDPKEDDKLFWDNAVPLEARLKYANADENAPAMSRKRQRKQVDRPGGPAYESEYYEEEESCSKSTTKKKSTKKLKEEKPPVKSKVVTNSKKSPKKKMKEPKRRGVQMLSNPPEETKEVEMSRMTGGRHRELANLLSNGFLSEESEEADDYLSDNSDSDEIRKIVSSPKKKRKVVEKLIKKTKKKNEETIVEPKIKKKATKKPKAKAKRLKSEEGEDENNVNENDIKTPEWSDTTTIPPEDDNKSAAKAIQESPIPRVPKHSPVDVPGELSEAKGSPHETPKEDQSDQKIPRRSIDSEIEKIPKRSFGKAFQDCDQKIEHDSHTDASSCTSGEDARQIEPSLSVVPTTSSSPTDEISQSASIPRIKNKNENENDDSVITESNKCDAPEDIENLKSFLMRFGRPQTRPRLFRKMMHDTYSSEVQTRVQQLLESTKSKQSPTLLDRVSVMEGLLRWLWRHAEIDPDELLWPNIESGNSEMRLINLVSESLSSVAHPNDLEGFSYMNIGVLIIGLLKFGWISDLVHEKILKDPILLKHWPNDNNNRLPDCMSNESMFFELLRDILAFLRYASSLQDEEAYSSRYQKSPPDIEAGECIEVRNSVTNIESWGRTHLQNNPPISSSRGGRFTDKSIGGRQHLHMSQLAPSHQLSSPLNRIIDRRLLKPDIRPIVMTNRSTSIHYNKHRSDGYPFNKENQSIPPWRNA